MDELLAPVDTYNACHLNFHGADVCIHASLISRTARFPSLFTSGATLIAHSRLGQHREMDEELERSERVLRVVFSLLLSSFQI